MNFSKKTKPFPSLITGKIILLLGVPSLCLLCQALFHHNDQLLYAQQASATSSGSAIVNQKPSSQKTIDGILNHDDQAKPIQNRRHFIDQRFLYQAFNDSHAIHFPFYVRRSSSKFSGGNNQLSSYDLLAKDSKTGVLYICLPADQSSNHWVIFVNPGTTNVNLFLSKRTPSNLKGYFSQIQGALDTQNLSGQLPKNIQIRSYWDQQLKEHFSSSNTDQKMHSWPNMIVYPIQFPKDSQKHVYNLKFNYQTIYGQKKTYQLKVVRLSSQSLPLLPPEISIADQQHNVFPPQDILFTQGHWVALLNNFPISSSDSQTSGEKTHLADEAKHEKVQIKAVNMASWEQIGQINDQKKIYFLSNAQQVISQVDLTKVNTQIPILVVSDDQTRGAIYILSLVHLAPQDEPIIHLTKGKGNSVQSYFHTVNNEDVYPDYYQKSNSYNFFNIEKQAYYQLKWSCPPHSKVCQGFDLLNSHSPFYKQYTLSFIVKDLPQTLYFRGLFGQHSIPLAISLTAKKWTAFLAKKNQWKQQWIAKENAMNSKKKVQTLLPIGQSPNKSQNKSSNKDKKQSQKSSSKADQKEGTGSQKASTQKQSPAAQLTKNTALKPAAPQSKAASQTAPKGQDKKALTVSNKSAQSSPPASAKTSEKTKLTQSQGTKNHTISSSESIPQQIQIQEQKKQGLVLPSQSPKTSFPLTGQNFVEAKKKNSSTLEVKNKSPKKTASVHVAAKIDNHFKINPNGQIQVEGNADPNNVIP